MKFFKFALVVLVFLQGLAFGDTLKVAALKAIEQKKAAIFGIGATDLKINPTPKEGDIEMMIVRVDKSLKVTDGDIWKAVKINEFEALLVEYLTAADRAGTAGIIVLEINKKSEEVLFEAICKVIESISEKYPELKPINEIGVRKLQEK